MESLVELLIPLAGILFPVAIVFVIFSFITKIEKINMMQLLRFQKN